MEMPPGKIYPAAMTTPHRPETFNEFWPYYLSEHADPNTRLLHTLDTAMALAFIVLLALSGDLRFLAAAAVAGYGLAWVSHLLHRTQPAGDIPLSDLVADGRFPYVRLGLYRSARRRTDTPQEKQF
jgi:hypothetical protein